MPLQDRLDRIREGFEKQAPPEVLATMHDAATELRESGMLDHVVSVGRNAPDFTLQDSRGASVGLEPLRAKGPTILTFFRGDW